MQPEELRLDALCDLEVLWPLGKFGVRRFQEELQVVGGFFMPARYRLSSSSEKNCAALLESGFPK